ncbi:hemolysin [Clostridium beijerinckii]|uniref:cysteine-S-conjugate beta-lyase n=1 Tax=Clostridium beijerinckii TaxID=1520 RepID=A0AB74VL56_CLOBE|nr:MalY/PatB family protein [Clostridium beijerinckii]NRZ26242.1 putative C-S lyase [Clostridium beijerinckii]NYB98755.1 putative C-S lyase [Clostridium beijerinckii]OOM24105.1 cystathionine beta-lyase PatB [Clostridium beijerinckii]QUN36950.1 pyridoxal phosphate-dependent aminotransferase [Clostridium beijerinckii]SQB18805.1 class I and II aminotransferase [Clostridium beijerinckii]
MKYDFETLVSRNNVGASKWNLMRKINNDVSESIVPFSVADMEFKNPPEIIEGLKEYIDSSIMGYTEATYKYYKAVCNWMERRHTWNIEKEWITEFSGVVPALYTIVRALTKEEDNVLVMTPVYYPFYKAITDNNRKIIKSELILNEDHYEINFEDFEEKAKLEETKLLILCNPHNPVGRVWSEEELKNIGRICCDNNVIVVSDEIHFDLIMPGFKHTVFANISEEFANNSVICTAPSKTFNLAGLQVSNIVIKNKKIRDKVRYERRKFTGNLGLNIFGYKACEIAYNECEQWLEELIQTINKNRKVVEDFFRSNIPEVNIINLEGTYLQWLDFRTLEKDHKVLEKFMITEAMFFLDEGYVFGDEGKGFERINLACPTKVLKEALDRLLEAVERCYR